MVEPIVSVIAIGYNAEKYIKRFAESVFKAKDDDFEFIFVGDGSTDSTSVIAANWNNKHNFRYI